MEHIKEVINRKGLKMKFVAKALGIHPTYLSQIINGHRPPKASDRAALAGFLGRSSDDIFFGKKCLPNKSRQNSQTRRNNQAGFQKKLPFPIPKEESKCQIKT